MKEYFPHDFNALEDPKLLQIQMEFGAEGYGIYWMIVEYFHRNKGAEISNTAESLQRLSYLFRVPPEKIEKILAIAFTKNELGYFSERILENFEKRAQISKVRSKIGKAGGERSKGGGRPSKTSKKQAKTSKNKQRKGKESKEKEIIKKTPTSVGAKKDAEKSKSADADFRAQGGGGEENFGEVSAESSEKPKDSFSVAVEKLQNSPPPRSGPPPSPEEFGKERFGEFVLLDFREKQKILQELEGDQKAFDEICRELNVAIGRADEKTRSQKFSSHFWAMRAFVAYRKQKSKNRANSPPQRPKTIIS